MLKFLIENASVTKIALNEVQLSPGNPRKLKLKKADVRFPTEEIKQSEEYQNLASLAKSIQNQGLLNPIWVMPRGSNGFELIAGERRVLASIIANQEYVNAKVVPKNASESDIAMIQWIENMERVDLNLHEKIGNLDKILTIEAATDTTDPKVVKKILGCSISQAANYLHAYNAPKEIHDLIALGVINNLEKAAIIGKHQHSDFFDKLVVMAKARASLKSIQEFIKSAKSSPAKAKKSVPSFKLGLVDDVNLAQKLIKLIHANSPLPTLEKQPNIDISNVKTLKKLIKEAFGELKNL